MLVVLGIFFYLGVRNLSLNRLFRNEYVRVIQLKTVRKLYPFVPKQGSNKYKQTKRFLSSVGWNISVEVIYLVKWGIFALALFMLVTIKNTNTTIELNEIVQDVNYNHNVIETLRADTQENITLEKELYSLVDEDLIKNGEIYKEQNRQMYIERIENLILQHDFEIEGSLGSTAQRLYNKVLQTRSIRNNLVPYVYILLISILVYYLPDILGQIKRKLVEDKKN
jgi:hypothetical protein